VTSAKQLLGNGLWSGQPYTKHSLRNLDPFQIFLYLSDWLGYSEFEATRFVLQKLL